MLRFHSQTAGSTLTAQQPHNNVVRVTVPPLRHRRERHGLIRVGNALNDAGILYGEKSFRNKYIHNYSQSERCHRDEQRRRLPVEHPRQHAPVRGNDRVEPLTGDTIKAALLFFRRVMQKARTHHRRQRQRDDRRNEDRHRQRDREFTKEPADDIAHEEQRDQHCDQRERQRDDREADLLGAFQRRGKRVFAFLDVARNVFDHHDGVVDDEAGRNGQGHQGQVIQAIAQQVHHGKCAYQRQGHRDAGDDGCRNVPQEDENHHDD